MNTDFTLINQKFVAFGTIPEGTSSKVQSEMRDFMNTYLQEELRRRGFEGIHRESFIYEPEIMTTMRNGRTLLGLKGELSTFLKLLRYSCKKIDSANRATWKDAIFFSEPTVVLEFSEMGQFTAGLEVSLDFASFIEDESDETYSLMVKSDDSMASSEGENETLLRTAETIYQNDGCRYCQLCSVM